MSRARWGLDPYGVWRLSSNGELLADAVDHGDSCGWWAKWSTGSNAGRADTLDEAKAAAEAAIRSHARRLLELVGEEP